MDVAGDGVVVVALVALLLGTPVPVGAVGAARRHWLRLPLPPLPLEVRPGHPSATHGQGASRCGRSRVQEGASSSAPAGGHVHRRCSPLRACSAQPAADLAWGVGTGSSGAVLQHHGTDAADQHRVDRRLGCLVPHHSRCWYSLLSDPHTPLVLLLSWLVMGLAFLSPPWILPSSTFAEFRSSLNVAGC